MSIITNFKGLVLNPDHFPWLELKVELFEYFRLEVFLIWLRLVVVVSKHRA